ncbi:MAG: hypothetical protein GXY53_11395 [Desulfobulbus sp.]|nr:hypothetical protein [Desulfobulbus sp.]
MIITALRLIIIALLIYAGVSFWYGRVEDRLQKPQQTVLHKKEEDSREMKEVSESPEESQEENYQIILRRNIFQALVGERDALLSADVDDLMETKLQLALLGTITGGKDDARAIIRDEKSALEELYPVGASVQGAVISHITRGKVVLLVNGHEEVLTIKEPESEDAEQRVSPRMDGRVMKQPGGLSEREDAVRVPEAQPRRRISFRNTGPAQDAEQVNQQHPTVPVAAEGMGQQSSSATPREGK